MKLSKSEIRLDMGVSSRHFPPRPEPPPRPWEAPCSPWRRPGPRRKWPAGSEARPCPEASAARGKMAAAAAGSAEPCGAGPGGRPRPRPQPHAPLAAGPALVACGDELVAAVWPYRRLALPRRLTVLPFAGLLYPAWLGAAAAGCWGWGSGWAQVPEAALLALAAICLAHALTVLSGHWSVHAHCALTCTPVSRCARPRAPPLRAPLAPPGPPQPEPHCRPRQGLHACVHACMHSPHACIWGARLPSLQACSENRLRPRCPPKEVTARRCPCFSARTRDVLRSGCLVSWPSPLFSAFWKGMRGWWGVIRGSPAQPPGSSRGEMARVTLSLGWDLGPSACVTLAGLSAPGAITPGFAQRLNPG